MKVKLYTVREVPDKIAHIYLMALRMFLPWVDVRALENDKVQSRSDDEVFIDGTHIPVTTSIQIGEDQ